MKNHTPGTIVIVPNDVQAGDADRYMHIEQSGEVLRLIMEEPLVFKDPVQVGENASISVSFDKIDKLRSNAAIITTLDSTDGPILVSVMVLDFVRSNWLIRPNLKRRVFAPDTGPTAIRSDHGLIVAVTQLRSAGKPRISDVLADS